ncbi:hypothetical protein KFE25_002994 [Diacronema lutheri]|uniref:Uncharacterized protein n=1 Tax=Diacronema lutheri TaxID=2081491 RepID=A0A8J5XJU1_DIALT|nr:hypothetical protein KFE25_002994 [Diacronema lutheri]
MAMRALLLAFCALAPAARCAVVLRHSRVVVRSRACIACADPASRPQPAPLDSERSTGVGRSAVRASLAARLARARKWAAAASSSVLLAAGASAPAFAARYVPPEVPKPKARIEVNLNSEPRELTGIEQAMAVVLGAAMASALVYVGKRGADREDREEEERIKGETERLKKMRNEFLMDEEVVKDDDLFSSLRKRMENAGQPGVPLEPPAPDVVDIGPGDFGPPKPAPPDPATPPPRAAAQPPAPASPARSWTPPAPPSSAPTPPARPAEPASGGGGGDQAVEDAGARDADIERLKRMFGN